MAAGRSPRRGAAVAEGVTGHGAAPSQEAPPLRRRALAGVAPSELSLGTLADVLGFHLARASAVTVELFERHVGGPLQLRKVEYSLLLLLQANGPLTPKRLLQALALSAPNLSLLIDRLEHRALVRRERSETDRRSQNIVLTDAGQALAQRGAEAAPTMERDLLDRLSHAERLMLIELLRKVGAR
jgi:DNA-binding MarR family transcriptional regulator